MPAAISWVLSHVAEPMDVRRRPEELARRLADAGTLTAVNVAAAGDPVAVGMIRDGGGHRMGQVLAGPHLHPVSNFFP
ncbi:MAG TPA: hypothetical protein VK585_12815 [Jiangellaceae bacterium]|nr:hypothetical protein [Jiangellaceae bacterium]